MALYHFDLSRLNNIKKEYEDRTPEIDVLNGKIETVKVHNHGYVKLVDCTPRLCDAKLKLDERVLVAARISTASDTGTKSYSSNRDLIRYLLRHKHTSPFEMIDFTFEIQMEMSTARQLIRHRTASVNEYSARYSEMRELFYRPEVICVQSTDNMQGSGSAASEELQLLFSAYMDKADSLYSDYEKLIDMGIAKEQARFGLPVSIYTKFYWKMNLHNLFHFLFLRMDAHAQKEIRDYAYAIFSLIRDKAPLSCEAFIDYQLETITLTRTEIEAIRDKKSLDTKNKREKLEFEEKLSLLGYSIDM